MGRCGKECMKSGGRTIVGGSYKSALSLSLCAALCCSDNIFKAHHVYDTCNRELIKSFALRDKPTLAGLAKLLSSEIRKFICLPQRIEVDLHCWNSFAQWILVRVRCKSSADTERDGQIEKERKGEKRGGRVSMLFWPTYRIVWATTKINDANCCSNNCAPCFLPATHTHTHRILSFLSLKSTQLQTHTHAELPRECNSCGSLYFTSIFSRAQLATSALFCRHFVRFLSASCAGLRVCVCVCVIFLLCCFSVSRASNNSLNSGPPQLFGHK